MASFDPFGSPRYSPSPEPENDSPPPPPPSQPAPSPPIKQEPGEPALPQDPLVGEIQRLRSDVAAEQGALVKTAKELNAEREAHSEARRAGRRKIREIEDMKRDIDYLADDLKHYQYECRYWRSQFEQLAAQAPPTATAVPPPPPPPPAAPAAAPAGQPLLQYCSICLRSVGNLPASAREKHLAGCGITAADCVALTTAQVKTQRKARRASKAASGGKKRQAGEEPVSGRLRKRVRKA